MRCATSRGYGHRRADARGDHAAARDYLGLWRGGPARQVRGRDRGVAAGGPAPPEPGPGPRGTAARRRPPRAGTVRQPPAPGGDPDHVALRRARRRRGLRRPAARRGRGPRRRTGPGRHPCGRAGGAGGGVRAAGGRAGGGGDEPGVRAGPRRGRAVPRARRGEPAARPVGAGHQGLRLHRQRRRPDPHHRPAAAQAGRQVRAAGPGVAGADRAPRYPARRPGPAAYLDPARPGGGPLRRDSPRAASRWSRGRGCRPGSRPR